MLKEKKLFKLSRQYNSSNVLDVYCIIGLGTAIYEGICNINYLTEVEKDPFTITIAAFGAIFFGGISGAVWPIAWYVNFKNYRRAKKEKFNNSK